MKTPLKKFKISNNSLIINFKTFIFIHIILGINLKKLDQN